MNPYIIYCLPHGFLLLMQTQLLLFPSSGISICFPNVPFVLDKYSLVFLFSLAILPFFPPFLNFIFLFLLVLLSFYHPEWPVSCRVVSSSAELSAFFLDKMGNSPAQLNPSAFEAADTAVHWDNLGPKGSLITFQDQWQSRRMCNGEQMLHSVTLPSASLCWPTFPVYPRWAHASWLPSRRPSLPDICPAADGSAGQGWEVIYLVTTEAWWPRPGTERSAHEGRGWQWGHNRCFCGVS